MILYRMQAHMGLNWANTWFGTLADAEDALEEVCEAGFEGHVDQMEVDTGKADLIAALNAAGDNRMNWPGIEKVSITKEQS